MNISLVLALARERYFIFHLWCLPFYEWIEANQSIFLPELELNDKVRWFSSHSPPKVSIVHWLTLNWIELNVELDWKMLNWMSLNWIWILAFKFWHGGDISYSIFDVCYFMNELNNKIKWFRSQCPPKVSIVHWLSVKLDWKMLN